MGGDQTFGSIEEDSIQRKADAEHVDAVARLDPHPLPLSEGRPEHQAQAAPDKRAWHQQALRQDAARGHVPEPKDPPSSRHVA